MEIAIGIGALVGIGILAFAAARCRPRIHPPRRRSTWLEAKMLRKVVVHLTDDRSLEGLLAHVGEHELVLRSARYLDSDMQPLAGEIFIARDRVSFLQLP